MLTNKVANSAAPRGVSGTRVERWHGLAEELVMSFAMGTHARLGRAWACQAAGAGGGRGGCRARPRWEEWTTGEPVLYDAGGSGEAGGGGVQMEGGGEGVLQLMGGRRRRVGT